MRTSGGFALARTSLGMGRWRRFLGRLDWTLLAAVMVLVGAGLANLYSATARTQHSGKFDQQLIWTVVGLGIYLLFTALDYRSLHRMAWLGLVLVIVAMVVVKLLADPIKGSQRWLELWGFNIQPSEFAKIAVILALARLMHDRDAQEMRRSDLPAVLIGIALPVLLVAWQPDLGTAILMALIIGSVCFLMASNLWPLVGGMMLSLAALPLLWDRLEGYQKDRIMAFLDPSADPAGAGYHAQQSIFAIGSGRITGKGFLGATQNHFNFLPEHWTDFPFSVWAEEWGFIGSVALILAFMFLILWTLRVALKAPDQFGTAISLGVAAMLFWHVVINIAMVMGLAPVVGVTLPFISYGGSSTLAFFLGLGLVSSVSLRTHAPY